MSKRNPPAGGAGETRAAAPRASILMQYPDLDGNPVFFDPLLVTGIREVVNTAKGVWQTLIFVGMPGGTTQVFTVFERAQMVGDRINMYRRGYGERLEAARGINYFVQKATEGDTEADHGSGKLVIPETMEFTAPVSAAADADLIQAAYDVAQQAAAEKPDTLAEDELS